MWRRPPSFHFIFGASCLVSPRRLLRRKRVHKEEENKQVIRAGVSSLRTGGMPAAPDTTLDKIKAEIHRMRVEQTAREESTTSEPVPTSYGDRTFNYLELDDWLEAIRPNEAYYRGDDVLSCVKAKDYVAKKQLFSEADEVLRGRNRENTIRYLRIVYGDIGSDHREEVMRYANTLSQLVEEEIQKVTNSNQSLCNKDISLAEEGPISGGEVKQIAWINVLSAMSDTEIRKLWRWGLLDFETIEHLAETGPFAGERETTGVAKPGDGDVDSKLLPLVGPAGEEGEESFSTSLPIEENIYTLKAVKEMDELTASVSESVFMGFPTIDVAPAAQKVKQGRYADVSERELRLLERYEETKYTVKVPPGEATTLDTPGIGSGTGVSGTTSVKLKCDTELGVDKASAVNNSRVMEGNAVPSSSSSSRTERKLVVPHLDVTESVMDRAFCPSNRFLYALTKYDDGLRSSFEGMERIKRRALLDPVFQAAVEEAHLWEDLSTQGHEEESSVGAKGKIIPRNQRHLRHGGVRSPILGGPLAKKHHAADIPYFYGNIRSFVPPHGRFNVPAPRVSGRGGSRPRRVSVKPRMRYSQ
ncbi:hypothetical protein, conserved [Trypanosoma brucei gambiense DAL972]|uniref:Uncharacterized protein n=2 Tax=Trypanosoma brucei TaxID=5691 RepID=C9ZNI2_TRYB9|nr:hypothetical protein, conserved [Trypanosoma brucei gambiense DAL972]RHW72657.1 hypothetical protein DPX39_050012100 [Trypanosoma brucei equiperdum]CBH10960.1 hypothetical protein, conserved [Trypanosoma brucei gambiense DAL972]|eukprot:XP_011773247.1 hypothetical protein, conserved [Trypanosoma brucei gambiense DAL972]